MASAAPIKFDDMSDEEFERRTLDVIAREFGPGGLVRFLASCRSGKEDYTLERDALFGHLTVEEVWSQMEAAGLTQG